MSNSITLKSLAADLVATNTAVAELQAGQAEILALLRGKAAATDAAPKKANPVSDGTYRAARLARRADASKDGGYGMTKAEKSAAYRKFIAAEGRRPSDAEWVAICAKVRGI
jgi:hypothetical protein